MSLCDNFNRFVRNVKLKVVNLQKRLYLLPNSKFDRTLNKRLVSLSCSTTRLRYFKTSPDSQCLNNDKLHSPLLDAKISITALVSRYVAITEHFGLAINGINHLLYRNSEYFAQIIALLNRLLNNSEFSVLPVHCRSEIKFLLQWLI